MPFKSERISRARKITLKGNLRAVFPMFGPIEEAKWAPGWTPEIIFSSHGPIEEHMVFLTSGHHGQQPDLTWIVSRYDPETAFIEYTVFANERLWWISIQCRQLADGNHTEADICYTYTGLSDRGNQMNRQALETVFIHDLKDWEEQINHFLETGRQMSHV